MPDDSDFASAPDLSESFGDPTDAPADQPSRLDDSGDTNWQRVVVLGAVGPLVTGVAGVLFLVGVVSQGVLAAGVGFGSLAVAAAVVSLVRALRAELARTRSDVREAVQDLRDRDPMDEREELIAHLRQQGRHTERLLEMLPEQREEMETLAAEVERRNRVVRAVLDDDISDLTPSNDESADTGPGADPAHETPSDTELGAQAPPGSRGPGQRAEAGTDGDGDTPTPDDAEVE